MAAPQLHSQLCRITSQLTQKPYSNKNIRWKNKLVFSHCTGLEVLEMSRVCSVAVIPLSKVYIFQC